jgi:hypothetical protein
MMGVTLLFGLPMLVAAGMIMPGGVRVAGLLAYAAIMLVLMPFTAWPIFATQLVVPTTGRSRLGAVFNLWIGGTLTAVCVIFFLASVLSYPSSGTSIDPSGHLLIPFAPRFGLALGLFFLCRPAFGARFPRSYGRRSRSGVR